MIMKLVGDDGEIEWLDETVWWIMVGGILVVEREVN